MSQCNLAANSVEDAINVGGLTGSYVANLHIQGTVELSRYSGGEADGHHFVGGIQQPADAGRTVAELVTPTGTHFLNNTTEPPTGNLVPLDYNIQLTLTAGAQITLRLRKTGATQPFLDDGGGYAELPQGTSFAGLGQFIQVKHQASITSDLTRNLGSQQFNKRWITFEDNVRRTLTER